MSNINTRFNANPQQQLPINNPLVTALDRSFKPIFTAPLSDIDGMAYGVREDFAKGNPRLTPNWCTSPCTTPLCASTRRPTYWLPHPNTDQRTTRAFIVRLNGLPLAQAHLLTYDEAQEIAGTLTFNDTINKNSISIEYVHHADN